MVQGCTDADKERNKADKERNKAMSQALTLLRKEQKVQAKAARALEKQKAKAKASENLSAARQSPARLSNFADTPLKALFQRESVDILSPAHKRWPGSPYTPRVRVL